MICLGLTNHENNVIRAAAMEAVTNLFIAIKRCYEDNDTSKFSSVYNFFIEMDFIVRLI